MREITSLQHPFVKQLVRLRDKRAERYALRQAPVEGMNLLKDLPADHPIAHLVVTSDVTIPSHLQCDDLVTVSKAVMAKVSGCETPPGVIAVLPIPELDAEALFAQKPQRLVVLDGVSDPGNMGTIFRTAAAFGWDGLLLLEGCCDPFNPKAIRAAKGATFRLPLAIASKNAAATLLGGYTLLNADLEGEPAEAYAEKSPVALVLSSEAHGVKEALPGAHQVTIPMHGAMESLNVAVAGAILMNALQGRTDG